MLTILIGLSGSGKSTVAQKYAQRGDIWISSDNLREELYGDVNDQSHNVEIFAEMQRRTIEMLKHGENVIYDATNLNRKKRKNFIATVKAAVKRPFVIRGIVMATPYEICLERNASRERKVPEKVIYKQLTSFQPPYYDEGFDDILIEDCGRVISEEYYTQLRNKMQDMRHDNWHHKDESIAMHCIDVGIMLHDNTIYTKDDPDYAPWYYILGFMHDCGKVYTKTIGALNEAHYMNHAEVSAYCTYCCMNAIQYNTGYTDYDMIRLAYVISLHMRHYSYKDEVSLNKWYNTLPDEVIVPLHRLERADKANSLEI